MTAQTFGGLVSQIDLRKITADLIKVLETGLLKHGLLVIPDQHLSAQELIHFARCLGSVEGDDGSNTSAARSITNRDESGSLLTETDPTWLTLNYPTQYWHSDGTFNAIPPKYCMLAADNLPDTGGHTEFADMAAAYDALAEDAREALADLTAFHSNLIGTTRVLPPEHHAIFASLVGDAPTNGSYGLHYRDEVPLRQIVIPHPVTKRHLLSIGRHTFGVVGMTASKSAEFLRALEDSACQKPRLYQHAWGIGDLVIWDNRRTLHRVLPYDYNNSTRILFNARIKGDATTDQAIKSELSERSAEIQRRELKRLRDKKHKNHE